MAVAAMLLGLYLLALGKPFYPFWEYALNKSYIAQTLCENKDKPALRCDGQCHLAQALKKANDAGDKADQPAAPRIIFDFDSAHLNPSGVGENFLDGRQIPFRLAPLVLLVSEVSVDIFHPPRLIFTLG
ncbi:MAG: hypothetical protein ALAOOOJD_00233 [bacterium]|nr:hypothetical protein [bacterium]